MPFLSSCLLTRQTRYLINYNIIFINDAESIISSFHHFKYMKKSLVRSDIVEVEIQRIPGPCCLVTRFSLAAVALCPEPFMFLLTTQYLSRSRLIFDKTKGRRKNTRQPFLTFLWGLGKSSAVLNLILSARLTARGDSARGFVSTVDPSLKAKMKRRGSLCKLQKSKSGSATSVWWRQNTVFLFDFILRCLDYDNKGKWEHRLLVTNLHTRIHHWQTHTENTEDVFYLFFFAC